MPEIQVLLEDPDFYQQVLRLGEPIEPDPSCLDQLLDGLEPYFYPGTVLLKNQYDSPYRELDELYGDLFRRRYGPVADRKFARFPLENPVGYLRIRILGLLFGSIPMAQPEVEYPSKREYPEFVKVLAQVSRMNSIAEAPSEIDVSGEPMLVQFWTKGVYNFLNRLLAQAVATQSEEGANPLPATQSPLRLMLPFILRGGFIDPMDGVGVMDSGSYHEVMLAHFEGGGL